MIGAARAVEHVGPDARSQARILAVIRSPCIVDPWRSSPSRRPICVESSAQKPLASTQYCVCHAQQR
jgi:hypothetical protein